MEVEDQQPPTATDLDTLKAEARDIVDKAAAKAQTEVHENGGSSENGEESENGESDHKAGDHVNGTATESDGENGKDDSAAEEDMDTEATSDEPAAASNGTEAVVESNGNSCSDQADEESTATIDSKKESHTAVVVNGTSSSNNSGSSNNSDNGKTSEDEAESDSGNTTADQPANNSDKSEDKEKKVETEDVEEIEEVEGDDNPKTPKKKVEEVSLEDSPPLRRSSRKKTPTKYAELEKDVDMVEEIREIPQTVDDDGDDSDIQEVEPEDPLGSASISITKSTKSSGSKKPNVVTIDDLRTLQRLATSAKKNVDDQKKENLTIIDTQAILAGKMGSGVSITPARPKVGGVGSGVSISQAGMTLGSGVTIKPNTPKTPSSAVTITSSQSTTPATPKAEVENYDPNLTDDTFVVEAPSFIVPYVYEKPPKEGIKDFKETIDKLKKELEAKEKEEKEKADKIKEETSDETEDEIKKKKEDLEKKKEESKKRKEERQKRRDDGEEDVEEDTDDEAEEEKEEKSEVKEEDKKDEDIKNDVKSEKEEKAATEKKEDKAAGKNAYFDSTLGKFFTELGMNLVQEFVQKDLLHQQKKRAQKDKSASVMHAIMSLQKNLDDSKESNEQFHFEMRKCKFCSFRTESRVTMQHHMETPHMKNFIYRCNFCEYETKIPQEVLFHMDSVHGVKGKLERAPYFHQCPQCPFEDNGKGKLTRHKIGCDKRFKSELNQIPERDWDPPAKIRPQPIRTGYNMGIQGVGGRGGGVAGIRPGQSLMSGGRQYSPLTPGRGGSFRGGAYGNKGRPVGSYKGAGADLRIPQPGLAQNKIRGMSPQMLASQQMLAALNQQGLSVYGAGKQGVKQGGSPSISITPLPGRGSPAAGKRGGGSAGSSPAMKPGQPGAGQGKGNFVICEICDGYIKDLEQLRNHMQWIHKVKIHPKMIYNRPPLNCQKCQFRFFTDQGLERHLLGSHGLVTASMQDSANKGQDSGRCPVCGKVYQWKLLNHVAKDHNKTLKPAHLSYKCTVCTATFGQYKLFETHVYTAHSGVAKKADKAKQAAAASKPGTPGAKPGVKPGTSLIKKPVTAPKEGDSAEVIDLDDEDDDMEKSSSAKTKTTEVIDLDSTPKKKSSEAPKRSAETDDESDTKKAKTDEKEAEKE